MELNFPRWHMRKARVRNYIAADGLNASLSREHLNFTSKINSPQSYYQNSAKLMNVQFFDRMRNTRARVDRAQHPLFQRCSHEKYKKGKSELLQTAAQIGAVENFFDALWHRETCAPSG